MCRTFQKFQTVFFSGLQQISGNLWELSKHNFIVFEYRNPNSTSANVLKNQLLCSEIRRPTFVELKTRLKVRFVFSEFSDFNPFNYQSPPVGCFLCNDSRVGKINLVACQVMVISYPIILFCGLEQLLFVFLFAQICMLLVPFLESSSRLTYICLRALCTWDLVYSVFPVFFLNSSTFL